MIIYLTTNLINGKKYIGKDSNNNPDYLGSGTLLKEDIILYGRENFKKEILEECENDEELIIRESFWIKHFNAVKSNEFYNLVDFSAGWNINKLGEEKYNYIINKLKESHKGIKPNIKDEQNRRLKIQKTSKGKPKPEGFGKKISKAKRLNPIKFTPEQCQKITQSKLGKPHPKSGTSITQLDKNNNIIREFKSIDEAAKSSLKFKRSNISCCLTGISKTAYGYKWQYK